MERENKLVVWKQKTPGKCFYDWNSTIILEITAILCLLFFAMAKDDTVQAWPYNLCIAAAVGIMLIGTNTRCLPTIIKGIPVLLYAVCYIGQACLTFGRVQAINTCMIPTLILNALKLVAGIAMICLVLALHCGKNAMAACLYWNMIGNACLFSVVSDAIVFEIAFLTLDIDALIGTGLYELIFRLFGGFWFSMGALITLHPRYVTVNYRKFNRLMWDFLTIAFWTVLIMVLISLIVIKSVNIHFIVWSATEFSMITILLKWVYKRAKLNDKWREKENKNYIKEFCSKRWFYSYYDIEDILSIQRRLNTIEMEQRFLGNLPFTDYIVERLNALDNEELDLQTRLERRYSISIV